MQVKNVELLVGVVVGIPRDNGESQEVKAGLVEFPFMVGFHATEKIGLFYMEFRFGLRRR